MRYIRYVFLAVVAGVLISLALANRGNVELALLPEGIADLAGMNLTITLPLFTVAFGGIVLGLLIGFVWEWLREHKHRATAARNTREVRKLNREVNRLKRKNNEGKDEVLALLDESAA